MSFHKRQAHYTKVLGNRGKPITSSIHNYYQAEPAAKPISSNLGSIQWPKTPSPPRSRPFGQHQKFAYTSVSHKSDPRQQAKEGSWIVGDKEISSEFKNDPFQSEEITKTMPTKNGYQNSQRSSLSPYRAKPVKLVPKETKSSLLRLESRSRSPSPQPKPQERSREASPNPNLPGRRKDYTKGKISQYSQYFSRKKQYDREQSKLKQDELRKSRLSYYGDNDEDHGKHSRRSSTALESRSPSTTEQIGRGRSDSPSPDRRSRRSTKSPPKSRIVSPKRRYSAGSERSTKPRSPSPTSAKSGRTSSYSKYSRRSERFRSDSNGSGSDQSRRSPSIRSRKKLNSFLHKIKK